MASCKRSHSAGGTDASQESVLKRQRFVNGSEEHDDREDMMTPTTSRRQTDDASSEPSTQPRQIELDAEASGSPSHPKDSETIAFKASTAVFGDAWHLVVEMCDARCAARVAMCSQETTSFGLTPGDPVGHFAEYAADVFRKMRNEEGRFMPCPDYMASQPDLNPCMRAILVDWLVDVHRSNATEQETLCLAVSCLDRYLSRATVPRDKLQLVGVVAMRIAFKVEDVYPRRCFAGRVSCPYPARNLPKLSQAAYLAYITDGAYSAEDVASMECSMLAALEYKVSVPTTAHFLARLQAADGCNAVQRSHTWFLAGLARFDYDMIKFSPLHIAASLLLLSNQMFERKPEWSAKVANLTQKTPDMLWQCRNYLLLILASLHGKQNRKSSTLPEASRRKWRLRSNRFVAITKFLARVETVEHALDLEVAMKNQEVLLRGGLFSSTAALAAMTQLSAAMTQFSAAMISGEGFFPFTTAALAAATLPAACAELSVVEQYKNRLVAIYQAHNPAKLGAVEALLAKNKDKEHGLYQRVCQKYGVPEEAELKATAPVPADAFPGGFFARSPSVLFGGASSSMPPAGLSGAFDVSAFEEAKNLSLPFAATFGSASPLPGPLGIGGPGISACSTTGASRIFGGSATSSSSSNNSSSGAGGLFGGSSSSG